MAAPATMEGRPGTETAADFKPYVPDQVVMKEFTWSAVILGSLLGIVFAGSSLYLVLKVGMTVSASIPVAVLAITVFRGFSKTFGLRRATILENNVVQTAGSAGESIAFGVGVTMPALLILGFDMDITRVMVVSVLGGLLGILAMIPLRRAFIVKLHGRPGQPGTLLYPEGTACAQVLISGEKGGTTGKTIFVGFGLAFVHKFITEGMALLMATVKFPLGAVNRAAVFAGDMASELLGVGYIIGLRTSAVMMAGAVLGYLVIIPLIAYVGDFVAGPVPPADKQLISQMGPKELRDNYLLFIGAGCVATAGLISMVRTLPMIVRSVGAGLRSIRGSANGNGDEEVVAVRRRTENDMSMKTVLLGSVGLIALLAAFLMIDVPIYAALAGAALVVLFGFLFVTVSARLTGEIGSSSNPISGMTVATLTVTCLIFLALGWKSSTERVLALSIAAVVCVAASNGGTTAQSLKTGFLVGGTPKLMQYAILIGAMTSALVIGGTLIYGFNKSGTVYSEKPENLPGITLSAEEMERLRQQGVTDTHEGETFVVWDTRRDTFANETQWRQELREAKTGTYLVDDAGRPHWLRDAAIMGKLTERDDGAPVKRDFDAPKTQVMGIVINGVLQQKLNWGLVLIGALIAVMLELCGVSALAFAVGLYVPIQVSTPIFLGGLTRWAVDRYMARKHGAAIAAATDEESRARAEIEAIRKSETSPGVLLAAGYIAGGSLAGMLLAFLQFSDDIPKDLSVWQHRKYQPAQAGSFETQSVAAAMQELGLAGKEPPEIHKAEVDKKAKQIQGLNEDVPVLWVPLPKGTVIRLPEYQTYEVKETTTLGEIASKLLLNVQIGGALVSTGPGPLGALPSLLLTPTDLAAPLYGLNKKHLAPDKELRVVDIPVEKGKTLRLPLKKTYVVEQDTYLADVAQQLLGRRDKAQTLMNLNKNFLEPPASLPAAAELKLPQQRWPALVFFGLLVALLAAVGTDKLLRVREEENHS